MDKLLSYDFKQNRACARDSNTLAQNTVQNSQRVLVDWVTASFEFASDVHVLFEYLGIDDLSVLDVKEGSRYEFAGYDITYRLGLLEIMSKSSSNVFLVNFSGEGCRQYELSSRYDIVELLSLLLKLYATFTRLDIAIDDYDNIYNVNTIRQAVYDKRCVTNLTEWGSHQKGKINDGYKLTMDNFYLGSRTSRYYLNIYDKKLERLSKNIDVDIETWTRTEIRFKYEYAQQFVRHIVSNSDNVGLYVKEFLNDKFCFLTPASLKIDSNKSRLSKSKRNHTRWWKKFIGNVGKLSITVDKPDKTLDDSKDWIAYQVSTTLAMLYRYFGDDSVYNAFLDNMTKLGMGKMQKKHYNKVNNQLYLDSLKEKKKMPLNDI